MTWWNDFFPAGPKPNISDTSQLTGLLLPLLPLMTILYIVLKRSFSKCQSVQSISFLKIFQWLPTAFGSQSKFTMACKALHSWAQAHLWLLYHTCLQPWCLPVTPACKAHDPKPQPLHRIPSTWSILLPDLFTTEVSAYMPPLRSKASHDQHYSPLP